jgi:hypothetical protein
VTFWKGRLMALVSSVVMLVALASPALADSTRVCNNRCGEVDQSTTIDNSQDNDTTINDNDTTNVDNDATNNIDNSVENNTTNNTTNNIDNDVCTISGPGSGGGGGSTINC